MSERGRDLLVGVFVLIALGALLLWLALLAGRTGATVAYLIHYDNVMGLAPGTRVLFEGYPIGSVSRLGPNPQAPPRFEVEVEVRAGWPIPVDSQAAVAASGLLSAIVIDVLAGSESELLQPGGTIRSGASRSVVAAMSSVAGEVSELIESGLAPLLQSLSEGAPEILDDVEAITGRLRVATERVDALLSERNTGRIEATLSDLQGAAGRLDALLASFDSTRADVDELLGNANALLDEERGPVPRAAEDLRDTLAALASRFEAISHNVELSSRNLAEFTEQIRANPGVLVRGRRDGDGAEP